MSTKDNTDSVPSNKVYEGGTTHSNTNLHRSADDLVVALSQLVGRNADLEPEILGSSGGGLLTAKGLLDERGTHLIYYVRDADIADFSANFVQGSQSKVKKIVTLPLDVSETDIIRINVFFYENPTFPTRVTTIKDYEELASWYLNLGQVQYDVNSSAQNNIAPN